MKVKLAKRIGASQAQINIFANKTEIDEAAAKFQLIELDKFHFISDWYHIAILELSCTEDFNPNLNNISRRLGITVDEARAAIDRLLRLGLMKRHEQKLLKVEKDITNFSPGQSSKAHKHYQRQIMEKGLKAIDECPQKLKDITSMSMAIDIAKLPEARKHIHNFRKKMCLLLEQGQQTEVYNLSIQLIPITKQVES